METKNHVGCFSVLSMQEQPWELLECVLRTAYFEAHTLSLTLLQLRVCVCVHTGEKEREL